MIVFGDLDWVFSNISEMWRKFSDGLGVYLLSFGMLF